MTPERLIQNTVCAWLSRVNHCTFFVHDSVGIFDPVKKVYRTNKNPYRRKGVADVIGIINGIPLAIEFKTPTGRVSPEQAEFLKDWEMHGGIALIIRSLEQAKRDLPAALLQKMRFLENEDGGQLAD